MRVRKKINPIMRPTTKSKNKIASKLESMARSTDAVVVVTFTELTKHNPEHVSTVQPPRSSGGGTGKGVGEGTGSGCGAGSGQGGTG
jgi:hypothetical protein